MRADLAEAIERLRGVCYVPISVSMDGRLNYTDAQADLALLTAHLATLEAETIERCARVAESYIEGSVDYVDTGSMWRSSAAHSIAISIRALPRETT